MPHIHEKSVIILAAGFSRRMGDFKPLMVLGKRTLLERMVSLYHHAGVSEIRVVIGHHAEAIRAALCAHPVTVVQNPAYESGMFSSVVAGIVSLPPTARSFFVHPVDIPLVRSKTLSMLMDAFDEHPSPVVYPLFDDRRGHPPLINREIEDAILSHDGKGGLQSLLHHFDSRALDIETADEGVLLDMDTPSDHQRLSARLATADMLTENECRVLITKIRKQAKPVIDHCRQVARVAATLAGAVARQNTFIDIPLIKSAALIHDVAKNQRDHASAGARLLTELGFPAMAAIVAVHMDINVSKNTSVDEAQVVHLADKLVDGDKVVNLQQRFDAKLKKYGHQSRIAAAINRRRQTALIIQDKIERISGQTIDQILEKTKIIQRRRSCTGS